MPCRIRQDPLKPRITDEVATYRQQGHRCLREGGENSKGEAYQRTDMDGGADNGQAQDLHKKDAKMEKKWEGPQRE